MAAIRAVGLVLLATPSWFAIDALTSIHSHHHFVHTNLLGPLTFVALLIFAAGQSDGRKDS